MTVSAERLEELRVLLETGSEAYKRGRADFYKLDLHECPYHDGKINGQEIADWTKGWNDELDVPEVF